MSIAAMTPGASAELLFPRPRRWAMKRAMDKPITDESRARQELVVLLGSVAAGDRGALRRLYDRTAAKLFGISLRITGNEADAADVLQDIYVTVWRRAGRFQPERASPITWLALIARSRAIDALRRRRQPAESIDAALDIPDEAQGAAEQLIEADGQRRLHECLERLDDRARTMIRAAFLDGLSYPELARNEGVPLGTMKSWVRRGLQSLKGCLEA